MFSERQHWEQNQGRDTGLVSLLTTGFYINLDKKSLMPETEEGVWWWGDGEKEINHKDTQKLIWKLRNNSEVIIWEDCVDVFDPRKYL